MTAASASPSRRRGKGGAPPSTLPGSAGGASEDDATQGEWLFKQDDLVLGPVSAIVLVEKLKKGELGGDTPIARDGQPFKPMKLIKLFGDAWQAAEEERRLAEEERAYQRDLGRVKLLRVMLVLMLVVIPAAVAGAAARVVMVKRPWDDSATWIAAVPPMVDVPQKPEPVAPLPTPPPVAVAAAETPPDAAEADDDDDDGKDPTRPKRTVKRGSRTSKSDPKSDSKTETKAAAAEDDGPAPASTGGPLPETLTNAQAIAPLKNIQGALKTCFKTEMDTNPDMPSQVVLSYTVTEAGRAENVSLDARELRGRPVVGCVQKAMATLKWPRFSGERKNVSVPFKLGRPKSPK